MNSYLCAEFEANHNKDYSVVNHIRSLAIVLNGGLFYAKSLYKKGKLKELTLLAKNYSPTP